MGVAEKVQHTPGPWTIDTNGTDEERGGPIAIRDADGRFGIASIWHQSGGSHDESQNEPNARLIAAAPDLLAVVQQIANWPGDAFRVGDALIAEARAAIAKAEGR
jgi:hypothetical protein